MTESLILQAHLLRMKKKESRRCAELQAQRESRDSNSELSSKWKRSPLQSKSDGACNESDRSANSTPIPLVAVEILKENKPSATATAGGPPEVGSAKNSRSPSPPIQSKSPPALRRKSIPLKITSLIGINPGDLMQQGFHLYHIEDVVEFTEHVKLKHEDMKSLIYSRLRQTQVLQSYWCKDRLAAAFEMMSELKSPPVDFLWTAISQLRLQTPKLKILVHLLPTLERLIESEFEVRVKLGMEYLSLILGSYEMVIKGTLKSSPSDFGTNLMMEERRSRCEEITRMVKRVKPVVEAYAQDYGGYAKKCLELCESVLS